MILKIAKEVISPNPEASNNQSYQYSSQIKPIVFEVYGNQDDKDCHIPDTNLPLPANWNTVPRMTSHISWEEQLKNNGTSHGQDDEDK